MTKCSVSNLIFPRVKSRKVEVNFDGGSITSDAGVVLLGALDRRLRFSDKAAGAIPDPRRQKFCIHEHVHLIRQRLFGLCCGYEDLNDHETLRHDLGFQTAVGTDEELASDSTLCRLENRQSRQVAWNLNKVLVDQFIASYVIPPQEIVLDFDGTDDPVHGKQEGRFFHGYYDKYCFLPLYVFCGNQLLVSYLRPSRFDSALHAGAILRLLVKYLRKKWPNVRIIFRGDSGFCRHRILGWCERNQVKYLVGLGRNKRLESISGKLKQTTYQSYLETEEKQRGFGEFLYGAKSWKHTRRVIVKCEYSSKGSNLRYVVTNLTGDPQRIYDTIYCPRGDMENRIKEQQLDLFADRTSCHKWWANQFRLLLSSLAYVLMERLRALMLRGTTLAKAQCSTIRLKLLKIGAVVIRNTRRVRLLLSSAYPYQELFHTIHCRLALE